MFEAELRYLHEHEWARSADDVLWRRTKRGLHLGAEQRAAVADWCAAQGDFTAARTARRSETTWN